MNTENHRRDEVESLGDENQPLLGQKIRYPRSIPFIISNEFCERFNFYGLRTILLLYLIQKLNYDSDAATVIFHLMTSFIYLCSFIGAVVADGFMGKFNTIFSLSIVYATGSSIVAIGSFEPWQLPPKELTLIGLTLIVIGSGGIKPCVSAFGGEQFKLPEQSQQLIKFFSIFYFAINFGSVLSTWITPVLRTTKCFGMNECYAAGFGLPAVLMILSIIVFVSGRSMYRMVQPQGAMLVKVCKCFWNAISMKLKKNGTEPRPHWLDHAEEKYGKKVVMESKMLFNVMVLFTPLPIFWALFDQQGSRWTLQATLMNGNYSFYTIRPDQIQVANPLMILIFIPLYHVAFYPLLSVAGIRRPLQKMVLGGILAGVAFLCSMLLQMKIDSSEKNSVFMLWQLPQYTIMTLAEILFSITGLEFAFTQAPESMKSVLQAFWMLTIAVGDLIVVLVVGARLLENQAMEFLLFAVLMFLDVLVFMWLAYRYKSLSPEEQKVLEE